MSKKSDYEYVKEPIVNAHIGVKYKCVRCGTTYSELLSYPPSTRVYRKCPNVTVAATGPCDGEFFPVKLDIGHFTYVLSE